MCICVQGVVKEKEGKGQCRPNEGMGGLYVFLDALDANLLLLRQEMTTRNRKVGQRVTTLMMIRDACHVRGRQT